jgi:hypothetical protein
MANPYGFIAGAYTAKYGGINVGSTLQGIDLRPQHHRDDIRIDALGDTIVEGVYRGYNLVVSLQLAEWTTAGQEAVCFPNDDTPGTLANIGNLFVNGPTTLAATLLLTPVFSGQKIYSFGQVIPDFDHGAWSLNNHLRVVTCQFVCLPDDTGLIYTLTTK